MGKGLLSRGWTASSLLPVLVMVAAGCSLIDSTPSSTIKSPYTQPPPTPTISPIATVADSKPGQPYVSTGVDEAFANSPAGFPAALRTEQIASAVADAIWTFDGRPYRDMFVDGSCDDGGRRCDLTITGLPVYAPDRDASDTWFWSVNTGSGLLTSTGTDLRGLPADLVAEADALARRLDNGGQIGDRDLLGATWLPPEGHVALRYGHGLEEGDPTITMVVDPAGDRVVSVGTATP